MLRKKKHVLKLFILNNYVKKLCGVQGNLYTGLSVINICAMFYIWLQQIQHLSKVTTLLVKANCRCCEIDFFFSISGIVAYPAGCTLVLYNPRKNKQQHIANPSKKTITSVGWWVEKKNHFLFVLLRPRTNKQFCEPAHFPNNSQVCTCNLVAVTLALSKQSL